MKITVVGVYSVEKPKVTEKKQSRQSQVGRRLGYRVSEEAKEKQSASMSAVWAKRKFEGYYNQANEDQKIRVQTPDGIFESRGECAKHYGLSPATISNRTRSEKPKWAGWRYLEPVANTNDNK